MIGLRELAALAEAHADDLDRPVAPLRLGDRVFDTDREPAVMGIVNLSHDSGYRDSIVTSVESAVRRGRVLAAQGAHVVDVGAESSDLRAGRSGADEQVSAVVPVIEGLAEAGVVVSIESYLPAVIETALVAGARVINLSGSVDDDACFELAAKHDATLVLCHLYGEHARSLDDKALPADPLPGMLEGFEPRIAAARARGVRHLTIDPGIGFEYGGMADPAERVSRQARVLLSTIRLRRLGLPVCHALPYAFELFEDQFRSAEGFFAVLAHLGGAGIFRTHEVPLVVAVLNAMHQLDVDA